MIKIVCEDEKGNVIDFSDSNKYVLKNIDGLNPPSSNIITYSIPNIDGALYRTSKMNTRNIVLTFVVKHPVEDNRLAIYRVFRSKHYIKVYIKTNSLDVFTEGYVESIECNNFSQKQSIQVSILCPDSYFKSKKLLKSNWNVFDSAFYFPFFSSDEKPIVFNTIDNIAECGILRINNRGDTETGMIIKITPKSGFSIKNLMITNIDTNEYIFSSRPLSSELNESLIINTKKGEKDIYTTYYDPDSAKIVTKSVIDTCIINSWLELSPSINNFRVSIGIIPSGYVTEQENVDDNVIPFGYIELSEEYYQNETTSTNNLEVEISADELWQGV